MKAIHYQTGDSFAFKLTNDRGKTYTLSQGQKFTTIDSDNDEYTTGNCASDRHSGKGGKGGWWYQECSFCCLTG